MTRGPRVALVLAVALLLAGATPTAGDRTPGMGDAEIASPGGSESTPANHSQPEGDETTNGEAVVIETENFDPNYDPRRVLHRVEQLRGLSATQGITLHEYDEDERSTTDVRDEFAAIRPAGARTLQLYSNASTERRQPLGYTVERQAAVHIYLMNASDLRTHGVSQEMVLAHELTHALQFQHDLLTPSRRQFRSQFSRWTTDSRLVTTAVVEGDAMWITEQYFQRYALGETDYTVAEYNRTLAREAWPYSVAGTPYYYGYEFYAEIGSSPEARSRTIEQPPTSTAELLHPDDAVERVALPDPLTPPADSDLTRYHTDTVGELVVRHALRINGLSFSRAVEVADGWANDRMDYFVADGAGPATHWTTVWESDDEAHEFATAWRSLLETQGARSVGRTLFVPADDHAPAIYYVVERDGAIVRITAAKQVETAERLAELAAETDAGE